MVGVYCSKGSEAVANDCEEGNQNAVDDVDHVDLPSSYVYPAFEMLVCYKPSRKDKLTN